MTGTVETTEPVGTTCAARTAGLSDEALRRSAWVVPTSLLVLAVASSLLAGPDEMADPEGDLSQLGFVLLVLSFPVTGAVIVRSQPHNRIGWLLQAIGVVWLVGAATDAYVTLDVLHVTAALPGAGVAAAVNGGIWAPGLGLTGTFLFLLYPDGRLPSPRWRGVAVLSAATVCLLTVTMLLTPGPMELSPDPTRRNPLGWESAERGLELALGPFLVLLPLCILACASALVVRFRRSRGVDRLQVKWLAAAGAVVATTFLMALLVPMLVDALAPSDRPRPWLAVFDTLSLLSFLLLPLAIGVALLRHRLYDIDLVIKRTLVYALLTATLVGVYLGSVLLLQVLLSPLTEESDLAVAGSTLAVAGVFRPAMRRIQHTVDRRFHRSRYDPGAIADDFAWRLRDELDVDAVGDQLLATVDRTLEPSGLVLWIKP